MLPHGCKLVSPVIRSTSLRARCLRCLCGAQMHIVFSRMHAHAQEYASVFSRMHTHEYILTYVLIREYASVFSPRHAHAQAQAQTGTGAQKRRTRQSGTHDFSCTGHAEMDRQAHTDTSIQTCTRACVRACERANEGACVHACGCV